MAEITLSIEGGVLGAKTKPHPMTELIKLLKQLETLIELPLDEIKKQLQDKIMDIKKGDFKNG